MFIAIIQARMGSSRLPNKVLMELAGTPSIIHTVNRVKQAKLVDEVIVATTESKSDESLYNFLKQQNISVFRGDENDVLKRYFDCYKNFKSHRQVKGIVRITGDCPLVEPSIIDRVLETFRDEDLDYCGTDETFAEGLDSEVFSPATLKATHENASFLSEREHVALYIHNNKHQFKYKKISNTTDDGKYRITLDEDEDYRVLKSIFENIPGDNLQIEEIKRFLDSHHEVRSINSSIVRNEGLLKSLDKDKEVK